MTLRISFHQSAELELKEAAQYYESEVPGLGKAFVDEVEHTLGQIAGQSSLLKSNGKWVPSSRSILAMVYCGGD